MSNEEEDENKVIYVDFSKSKKEEEEFIDEPSDSLLGVAMINQYRTELQKEQEFMSVVNVSVALAVLAILSLVYFIMVG